MADHRPRIRATPAGSTAAFGLALLFLCGLALLAPTRAPAFDFNGDAQARNLGDAFARLALDTPESRFLLQSGQISQQAYQERLQRDRAALPRLQQALARLSGAQQAEARQQAATRFNQGLADLHRRMTDWQQQGRPRGRQRAGSSTAPTDLAAAPPPYVPPAPYVPPGQSNRFERLLLLLLGGGAVGAVVVVIARRRRSGTPALPPDAEEIPVRSAAPAPALPPDAGSLPAEAASGPVAPRPVGMASATPVSGDAKERLLAEQTAKYQATLSAAMDELTATQVALEERKTLPELIDKDLARVGGLVYERVRKLLQEQTAGMGKAVLHAFLLLPLWNRFWRGGIGFKIVLAIVAYWVFGAIMRLTAAGFTHTPIVVYGLAVGLCFYFGRRAQTRGTVKELEANAATLQHPSLLRIHADQAPGPLWLLRFWSAAGKPPCDEAQVTLPNVDAAAAAAGGTLLSFGDMATYRIAADADPVLGGSNAKNAFMIAHAALLQRAVLESRNDLVPILKHAELYAQLKWRERRQKGEIPRLEALLANIKRLADIWASVYASDKVFEFLIRRIDLFNLRDRATPAGILLHGYPGNGKEFLAQTIARSAFAQFIKPTADQLGSAKDVTAFWGAVKSPAVLFVEYADHLFPKPGSEQDSPGAREATLAWIEEWTRREPWQSGIWVVMTAQQEKNVHPRLLSVLGGSKIEVTAPESAADRAKLLALACAENELPGRAPQWLIDGLGGASIRELREIVRETKVQCVPNAPREEHWRAAVTAVRGSEGVDRTKTWDRLVLPQEIKDKLKRAVRILRETDRYKGARVNVPNILLFGPPGTGKTDIARTFANEGGVKFIAASTGDLKGQYTGQSGQMVRELFGRARASAPCVLFIDEIEAVTAKRTSGDTDSFTKDIVTEMLAQMEGASKSDRPVIVLAATNLPETIEQAILDRFTSKIEIPLPDEPARAEILERLMAERPCDPALDVEETAAFLAKRLNRKSGRDLVQIVNRAMERAVDESDSPETVSLTRDLLLKEALPQAKEVSEAALAEIWAKIVLKPSVKQDILDKIRMFNRADKAAPSGLLLYGPPGTGKTEIARRLADSASCYFMSLKGPDLKSSHVGGSGERVQKIWEQARARGRCVMFIDECEGVFARRGGTNTDAASEELVQAFLAEWDGVGSEDQRVWVVGATNRKDLLDDAITSRFGAEVEIGLPEAAERLEILRLAMVKLERSPEIPQFLGQETVGFSGRNLSRLASDVCVRAGASGGAITEAFWRDAIKKLRPSEAVDAGARWDSLILAPDTLAKLKGVCEGLRHVETLRKQGVPPPKGALLYGPPGTGKTQIARTLANESGLAFIAAGTADLKAGFIGQSGQKVRELFERARGRAPCILFLDEIDAIAPARGGSDSDSFTVDIVNQLLQEMDGIKATDRHVYVLAATNRPETVDEALRSRLKDTIEIPNPDREQRQQLFRLFMGKLKTDFDADEMAAELARRTNNVGGRAISAIIERAAQEAVNRAIAQGTPDNVVLTRADVLREVTPRGKEVSEADLTKVWEKIILKPAIKQDLLDKIRVFNRGDKAAPTGLLLYGPPGTGKTEIARRIADSASCYFMSLKGPDLKAGYVGQSGERVKKTWAQARARGRCVMFIDECEGVFARRGGTNTDGASEELVQAFLAEWDGVGSEDQRVWVVGATNRKDLLDDAITSRFGAEVEIGLPEAAERLQILRLEMLKLDRPAEVPEFLGQETVGFSGRNLSRLASDVCVRAGQSGAITDALWRDAIKRLRPSEAVDAGARWDSLILAPATLTKLKGVCEALRHVETLRKQGIPPPKGALLYGPPGTGKTQIARTLANESGLAFIAAGTADLKAGFVGQSGQKVRELFERARGRAPCILFLDEIDAVAPARGGSGSDAFTVDIVNQLLQEMDGIKATDKHVYVLAATNRPETVDEALRSRLKESIEVPNPDREQRQQLFRLFFGKLKTDFDADEMAAELAKRTHDIGGRAISAIVERAAQEAVNRAIAKGAPDRVVLTREDVLREMPAAGGEERADADPAKSSRPVESEVGDKGGGWDSLALAPDVLEKLKTLCETLRHVEDFIAQGFEAPAGALLFGPPGAGKTQIARTLDKECGLPFIAAGVSQIKGQHVGQSSRNVRQLFETARARAPCIVFMDDIDSVAPARGSERADSFSEEIVSQLLQEMDDLRKSGRPVFVLAATSMPDLVDEALLSRLTEHIEIPNPDAEQRARLFRMFLGKLPVASDREALAAELTERSDGLAVRDIRGIVQRAAQKAVQRAGGNPKAAQLSRDDLIAAVPAMRRPELVWSRGKNNQTH
jgi:SpoVK/Ycf46/Vps4 family AAA+-type ATPase